MYTYYSIGIQYSSLGIIIIQLLTIVFTKRKYIILTITLENKWTSFQNMNLIFC